MPPGVPRDSMLKLFSQHGRVRHLQLYADDLGALTSGTVTMFSRNEAATAMAALDGAALSPGAPGAPPLKVAWAQLNVLPKAQQSEVVGATVAYSAVPPAITPHEVAALFQRFGPVLKVIPFPARPDGPPGTRGCGRVIMAHPVHADSAAAALNGKFTWPGAEFPLFVQPLHDVPASAAAFAGPGAMPAPGGGAAGGGASPYDGPAGAAAAFGQFAGAGALQGGAPPPAPLPPPECEPGAYPLLLANLPPWTDESELYQLLSSCGRVARLDLVGAAAGGGAAAAVWFVGRMEADLARATLNGQLLNSPGEAAPRQLHVVAAGGPVAPQQHPMEGAGGAMGGLARGGGAGMGGGGHLGGLLDAAAGHLGGGGAGLLDAGWGHHHGGAGGDWAGAAPQRQQPHGGLHHLLTTAGSGHDAAAAAAQRVGAATPDLCQPFGARRPSSSQSWATTQDVGAPPALPPHSLPPFSPPGAQGGPPLPLPRPAAGSTPIPDAAHSRSASGTGPSTGGSSGFFSSHLSSTLGSFGPPPTPGRAGGPGPSSAEDDHPLASWVAGQAGAAAAAAAAADCPAAEQGSGAGASPAGSLQSSP
jgi:hypothetical protein